MQIYKILHKQEEPYKEVFWMRTFLELPFKEIAYLFEKQKAGLELPIIELN